MIKEYITQTSQNNDEVFKGICERLDSKIDQYESTIEQLTLELQAAKKDEMPYMQIANEISESYPDIKHVFIGQGRHIALDSLTVSPCLIVKVKSDTLMSESSLEQFKKWIKVRLQSEYIEIDYYFAE
ncbi:MAG: hypothetical protein IJ971_08405 [Bacteroidales bacterium]|nr:hypothetical protein [Bacteroidales bacterium]